MLGNLTTEYLMQIVAVSQHLLDNMSDIRNDFRDFPPRQTA
jgi:hypothetical protein